MSQNETPKHGFDNPNYGFPTNRVSEDQSGIELQTTFHVADSEPGDENEMKMDANADDFVDNSDKTALMNDDKLNRL